MTDAPTLGPRPRVGLGTKILYGLGSVAFGIKDNGYKVFLILYYNLVVGLDPLVVAAAVGLALLIDCVFDPIIGEWSDNLRSRWGRRHPFMYASALPAALCFLLLWNPPMNWGPSALFWYLVAVAVLGRTFITLYEIPSSSLSAELTEDYDERAAIIGWRYFFAWWGGLTLTALMFMVFLKETPEYPKGQLNPEGYKLYGYLGALLMFISIIASTLGTHRFIPWLRAVPVSAKRTAVETVKQMATTLSNKNFVIITLVGLFAAIAQGIGFSLGTYIATYFWDLSAFWTGILILDSYISSTIALLAAPLLSKRSGKKLAGSVLLAASVFTGFVPLVLALIGWFPDNAALTGISIAGNSMPQIVPWLFLDGVIRGAFGITAAIMITAMLSDVVEDSEVQTGRRSEGLFFAFTSLVQKAVGAMGGIGTAIILTVVAFPKPEKPGGPMPEVTQDTINHLVLVYMPTLAILYVIALVIMQAYSISRERHAENLRIIGARAAGIDGATTPQIP